MYPALAKAGMAFLTRATLSGQEVPTFVHVSQMLNEIASGHLRVVPAEQEADSVADDRADKS